MLCGSGQGHQPTLLRSFGWQAYSAVLPLHPPSPSTRPPVRLRARAVSPFDVAPIRLRFIGAFEDMRGDAAFFQSFAELDAQEARGGVAGDAGIKTLGQAAHHRRI